jgi:uncharacterized membrane protein YbhN (UPF0104 family)
MTRNSEVGNGISTDSMASDTQQPKGHQVSFLLLRLGSLAILILVAVFFRTAIRRAVVSALDIGWSFLWLIPLFTAWSLAATVAWREVLAATPRRSTPGLLRLFVVRTEALAVSSLMPTAGLGGDVLRVALTKTHAGVHSSAPPVFLDRLSSTIAEVAVAALGLVLFAFSATGTPWRIILAALATALLLAAIFYWRALLKLSVRLPWVRQSSKVRRIVVTILTNRAYHPALSRSVGWHLVERILMVGEIWLIGNLLGLPFSLVHALFAAALTTFFAYALFFMPGQLGAFEGGLAFAFSVIGLPPAAGLSAALIHRGRQLLVAGAGLLLLLLERGGDTKGGARW